MVDEKEPKERMYCPKRRNPLKSSSMKGVGPIIGMRKEERDTSPPKTMPGMENLQSVKPLGRMT